MDRFLAMSMLLTVTEKGSLSAAGRELQVPLATLSRRISDLERHLGTRLLIRTTRKLTLTDAGIAYVSAARRILEQVEEAEREAAGEFTAPKGELVLTAPIMFGRLHVLPVVADFLATFPEINIRLILVDRNVARKSATTGSTCNRPNMMGAVSTSSPLGAVNSPAASRSASSTCSRILRTAE